jgi:hypothetical protein
VKGHLQFCGVDCPDHAAPRLASARALGPRSLSQGSISSRLQHILLRRPCAGSMQASCLMQNLIAVCMTQALLDSPRRYPPPGLLRGFDACALNCTPSSMCAARSRMALAGMRLSAGAAGHTEGVREGVSPPVAIPSGSEAAAVALEDSEANPWRRPASLSLRTLSFAFFEAPALSAQGHVPQLHKSFSCLLPSTRGCSACLLAQPRSLP